MGIPRSWPGRTRRGPSEAFAQQPTVVEAHAWAVSKVTIPLERAVRMVTFDTAQAWGFHDRGLLREGLAADLCVFDPATIGPGMPTADWDLPGGAKRLKQKATGIAATVVNGQPLFRDGEHTGALPGRLLRGPLAAR